jgi:hypothetical protein
MSTTSLPSGQEVLHLFALTAFAVAQPLFDLLGRYPTFFVAHAAQPGDLVWFALVLCLAPPLALLLVEAAVGAISGRARRALHLGVVAALVGIIVLPPLHRAVPLPSLPAFATALAAGAAAAWAYARIAAVRSLVTVLAAAALVFPALFLFASPVRSLVRPEPPAAIAAGAVARPAPVVLVVFDEFSLLALLDGEGGIDAVRYPNFAALAGTATWYRNATAVSDYTTLAVPAILTGVRPDHNRLPTAGDHPHNLFTLLAGTYDLEVTESVTELCPRQLCRRDTPATAAPPALPSLLADAGLILAHAVAPPRLRATLPDIRQQWTFRFRQQKLAPMLRAAAGNRADVFARFTAAIVPRQRPTLWFLHVLLPHHPYKYFPSGTTYEAPPSLFGSRAPQAHVKTPAQLAAALGDRLDMDGYADDDREAARQQHLRYLNQLAFVDRLLGELVAHLRQVGLFDPALLVVTADHGVCLRPGCSPRFANERNLGEIMAVPLFVKAPQQRRGRIDDGNAETIDVLPTIADVLGVAVPWAVDGQSVATAAAPRPEKVLATPLGMSNLLDLRRLVAPAARPEHPLGQQYQLALFGAGTPLAAQASSPAFAPLIDQPLAAVARSPAAVPYSLALHAPEAFADVERQRAPLPAFVRGSIDGGTPPPPGTPLAIAVNGVVRAVTEVLADDAQAPSFGALVPEQAWQDGVNRVEIFAVSTDDGGPRLAPVPTR